ncbi:MAG TPA: putative glycolipid-binding domain-containing protein [Acidobacteriota bacterium]
MTLSPAGANADRCSILWRRLDQPGHESARLRRRERGWELAGAAEFLHQGKPCHLSYEILCDPQWRTSKAAVRGWVGLEPIEIDLAVDAAQRWRLGGAECPAVTGCIDLDLNFSPSTNLLPIRRLALAVGEQAEVRAAWLRFPSFRLEPLAQLYRRSGESAYRYESAGGSFVADLQVNPVGLVTEYPNIWQAIAAC